MSTRTKLAFIILAGSILLVTGISFAQDESNTEIKKAPRLVIITESDSFLPGDEISFGMWIENPTPEDLSNVELNFSSPDFIFLSHGDCPFKIKSNNSAWIGNIRSGMAFQCHPKIMTNRKIGQGEYTIVFSLKYQKSDSVESFLISAKKVQVSLFGSQTVAGINIAFLAYLVPGLVVIVLLRFLNIPAIDKLTTLETTAGAVLFSIAMIITATWRSGGTISRVEFFILCVISFLIGVISTSPFVLRRIKDRRQRKLLISKEDTLVSALNKAFIQKTTRWWFPWSFFRRYPPFGPVYVELNNDSRYWGSLDGQADEGEVKLFGWYQVDPGKNDELRNKLQGQITRNDIQQFLRVMQDAGLNLESAKNIHQMTLESKESPQPTSESEMLLKSSDLRMAPYFRMNDKLDAFPFRLKYSEPKSELSSSSKTSRGEPRDTFV